MTFSAVHILITAVITGLAAAGVAWWRLGRDAWPGILAVRVLVFPEDAQTARCVLWAQTTEPAGDPCA
jgi:hypothetical protein